jgi:hypothetical protein
MEKREIIKRRIFLKRQLMQVTEKEIEALEDELKRADVDLEAKHEPS